MNYRERLREDIKCPQLGDITYGRLGSLKYEDRKSIKRLLDEMDRADEVIKKQFFELNKQKEVLNKINKILESDLSNMQKLVAISVCLKKDKILEEIE